MHGVAHAIWVYCTFIQVFLITPRKPLPDFSSPSTRELKATWKKYCAGPDKDVERLLFEVVRLRELVRELDEYFGVVQKVWGEFGGGHLVAIYKMRLLFTGERSRMGVPSNAPTPPRVDGTEASERQGDAK